ncbi:MAG: hypothetical protein CME63_15085 [Halobacteriovoraceae bacterium]|nr:hypothetical protein [Halobacteriovoraceae bacterium]MBC99063.1 hypothetical protein [Halobacteriovoraceae bacterium]
MLRRVLPLTIVQRYLGAHFIAPFVFSTLFFVVFLLTFQMFRIIRIVTSKGVDIITVFELMGHIAVSFLPMAIPLSALFAMIFTLNKLSEDSEIVAMRSFGLKKSRLILPFIFLSLLIAAMIFVLNRNLIPHSKTMFKNTIIQLTSRGNMTDIKSGQFFTEIPNITLFAENVDEGGVKLNEVFILQKKDIGEHIIFAKRGALIKQSLGELRTPGMRLHLEEGNIVKFSKGEETEKILFQEYDFPVISGGGLPGFVTKDSMRSNAELKAVINERRAEINKLEALKAKGKISPEQENDLNDIKKYLPKSEIEFWTRYNTPIQVILFMFLGFSLGIKRGRGKTKSSGSLGMIFLISYYVLFFGGVSLARKGTAPAYIVVFLPTFITFILGARFYQKLDWQS